MLNKPRCGKAQNLPHKLPLYCEGKFLCAHQYNCPQTRQYENTADFAKCKRLSPKEPAKPQTAPVKFVVNVAPKEPAPADNATPVAEEPKPVQAEEIKTPIYTKNVSPIDYGVKKESDTPAEPMKETTETNTVTNKEVRKEQKNGGAVRKPRSRRSKKV